MKEARRADPSPRSPGSGGPDVACPIGDDLARKRALRTLLEAKEPLEVLEGKLGEFVEFVCVEIDDLCRRLREDLDLPGNSRVVADFDRLTHAMERLRNVLVEKRTEDEPDAAETFLDLMQRENGTRSETARLKSPSSEEHRPPEDPVRGREPDEA